MRTLTNEYKVGDDIVLNYDKEEDCLMYGDEKIVFLENLYLHIQNTRLFLKGLDWELEKEYDEANFHYQISIEVIKGEIILKTETSN